jgi:hypothetical protein
MLPLTPISPCSATVLTLIPGSVARRLDQRVQDRLAALDHRGRERLGAPTALERADIDLHCRKRRRAEEVQKLRGRRINASSPTARRAIAAR